MGDIKNYQMLINGDWVDASDGGTFDSVNPSTGEIWSRGSRFRRYWGSHCQTYHRQMHPPNRR